jgi:hypothetical protein
MRNSGDSPSRERSWQRDSGDRKFYERSDGSKVYENRTDRDAALDGGFIKPPCGDNCCANLLAYVSAHGSTVAMDYMAWVSSKNLSTDDRDTLRRYEVDIFGDRLEPAAHGVLAFAASTLRFGDRYDRLKKNREYQPKLTPGLTSDQRRDRMLEALDKNFESKVLPMHRQSWKDKDDQTRKLQQQAREEAARAPAGEKEEDDDQPF